MRRRMAWAVGWTVWGASMLSLLGCTQLVDIGSELARGAGAGMTSSGGGGGQGGGQGGAISQAGSPDAGGSAGGPSANVCSSAGRFDPRTGLTNSVAYTQDGLLYATGSGSVTTSGAQDSDLRVFRTSDDALVFEHRAHGGSTYSVAFSPDGSLLASAGEGTGAIDAPGVVKLWRTNDGTFLGDIPARTGRYANGVEFSHDGLLLATTGMQDNVELWNVSDRSRVLTIAAPPTSFSARFSPDDALLVITSTKNVAEVRSTTDGSLVTTLTGHRTSVFDAVFSPDGSQIATAGNDGSARIWDAATGATIQVLEPSSAGEYLNRALWYDATHLLTQAGSTTLRQWVRGNDGLFAATCERSLQATSPDYGHPGGVAISPDHREVRATGASVANGSEGLWTLR